MEVVYVERHADDAEYARKLYEALERGNVLVVRETPFMPSEADAEFLRAQAQSESAAHKNIAYKPDRKRVTGMKSASDTEAHRSQEILARYSQGALDYLGALLPDYARQWRVDYASFRPIEEQGRDLPLKHRNDLMHVDAFPTRPTHGGRILRAFTNLHPSRDRVWATSAPFEELAKKYAAEAGLHQVVSAGAQVRRTVAGMAHKAGLRVPDRSPYDEFMLRFHHYLKGNEEFQRSGRQDTLSFLPGSTWISFTDQIAHAALSGQYALEQTVIVPLSAMVLPELAPAAVLSRLAGRPLVSPQSLRSNPSKEQQVPA